MAVYIISLLFKNVTVEPPDHKVNFTNSLLEHQNKQNRINYKNIKLYYYMKIKTTSQAGGSLDLHYKLRHFISMSRRA